MYNLAIPRVVETPPPPQTERAALVTHKDGQVLIHFSTGEEIQVFSMHPDEAIQFGTDLREHGALAIYEMMPEQQLSNLTKS